MKRTNVQWSELSLYGCDNYLRNFIQLVNSSRFFWIPLSFIVLGYSRFIVSGFLSSATTTSLLHSLLRLHALFEFFDIGIVPSHFIINNSHQHTNSLSKTRHYSFIIQRMTLKRFVVFSIFVLLLRAVMSFSFNTLALTRFSSKISIWLGVDVDGIEQWEHQTSTALRTKRWQWTHEKKRACDK